MLEQRQNRKRLEVNMENIEDSVIVFEAEDGTESAFRVVEQTTLGGINYLFVIDMSDENSYLILREEQDVEFGELVTYDIVEDERELSVVAKIFQELLEDVYLEV